MTLILCFFLIFLHKPLVFSSLLAIHHGSPPVRRLFREYQGYKPIKERFSPRFLQKSRENVTNSLENQGFFAENASNSRHFPEVSNESTVNFKAKEPNTEDGWSFQSFENKAIEVYDVYHEYYQHFSTQISNNNEFRNLLLLTIVIFGLILVIFCRNCWERVFLREKARKLLSFEDKAAQKPGIPKKMGDFRRNAKKFCNKSWEKGYEAEESEETEEKDALEKVFNDLEEIDENFQRNGFVFEKNYEEDDSLHIDIESFMRELGENSCENPHFAKENLNILEEIDESNNIYTQQKFEENGANRIKL